MAANLDERDLRILEKLAENARITYTDLARAVGLSDVAVIKRVRKLEEKVIKRYTVVVDPREIGYKVISFTGIDVDPEKLFEVVETLKNKNYLKGLWITTGDHQLLALVWAKDEEEAAKIHKEISEIEGVKRICPAIILKTIKDTEKGFYIE